MNPSDAQIREEVERLLRETSRVDWHEVQVAVADSIVTLTGAVDSAREKRNARQLAEDVQGVRHVDDQMQVKNFVKRPDAELAEEVRHALLRDAYVESTTIEVSANAGEIQLDGSVPTYHMRKAVEDVTWWTPGVINVDNLLLVTDEEFVDVSQGEVVNS